MNDEELTELIDSLASIVKILLREMLHDSEDDSAGQTDPDEREDK